MLINDRTGQALAHRVTLRRTAWEMATGLMFRRGIDADEAMVFYLPKPGIGEAGVHVLFVPFPIALFWLDGQGRVVDKTLAQPWRRGYRPKALASYFVEAHPSRLAQVREGDRLQWRREQAKCQ